MYQITPIVANKQGEEVFQLNFADGRSEQFHIWDYDFLYRHPQLYQKLIVELLDCQVYQAISDVLQKSIHQEHALNVVDIACGSGLMGKYLKQQFIVNYLAGIEINSTALEALNRDNPNIYDECYLVPQDDFISLKQQPINCLIFCGAANHLSLEDYQAYLGLLSEQEQQGWVVFNLVSDPEHQQRQEILSWMDAHYHKHQQQFYPHRKLLNGQQVEHEVFLYQTR